MVLQELTSNLGWFWYLHAILIDSSGEGFSSSPWKLLTDVLFSALSSVCWGRSWYKKEETKKRQKYYSNFQNQFKLNKQTSLQYKKESFPGPEKQEFNSNDLLSPEDLLCLEQILRYFQDSDILCKTCVYKNHRDNHAVNTCKLLQYGSCSSVMVQFPWQLPLKYNWVLALQKPGRWHAQTQLPRQENILKVAGHKSRRYPPLQIRNGL